MKVTVVAVPIDYLASLHSDVEAIAEVARKAPPDLPITSCPGWDMTALLRHVGRVHRWATVVATSRTQQGPPPTDPVTGDNAVAFLLDGAAGVEAALRALPNDAPCWNFTSAPQVGAFWHRRQAQETAVHRWDAEDAFGDGTPFSPEFAVDGIDEFLSLMAPSRLAGRDGIDVGGSIHLHTTDHDGEWMIHTDDGLLRVTNIHGKGDVALRGPASALLLALWGRVTPGSHDTEVYGDAAILERFIRLVSI